MRESYGDEEGRFKSFPTVSRCSGSTLLSSMQRHRIGFRLTRNVHGAPTILRVLCTMSGFPQKKF
jgi:hypothetical protein